MQLTESFHLVMKREIGRDLIKDMRKAYGQPEAPYQQPQEEEDHPNSGNPSLSLKASSLL